MVRLVSVALLVGKPAAVSELLEHVTPIVARVARRMLRGCPSQTLEDLTQEAMAALWHPRGLQRWATTYEYENLGFEPFVWRVAERAIINKFVRNVARRKKAGFEEVTIDFTATGRDATLVAAPFEDTVVANDLVTRTFQLLSSEHQKIFFLRHYYDCAFNWIARVLRISAQQARDEYKRARERMRRQW